MFAQQSAEDELSSIVDRLLSSENAKFKKRLLSVLSALPESQWVFIQDKMYEFLDERENADAPPAAPTFEKTTPEIKEPSTMTDEEIEREVEAYREQLRLQKKATLSPSSTGGEKKA